MDINDWNSERVLPQYCIRLGCNLFNYDAWYEVTVEMQFTYDGFKKCEETSVAVQTELSTSESSKTLKSLKS